MTTEPDDDLPGSDSSRGRGQAVLDAAAATSTLPILLLAGYSAVTTGPEDDAQVQLGRAVGVVLLAGLGLALLMWFAYRRRVSLTSLTASSVCAVLLVLGTWYAAVGHPWLTALSFGWSTLVPPLALASGAAGNHEAAVVVHAYTATATVRVPPRWLLVVWLVSRPSPVFPDDATLEEFDRHLVEAENAGRPLRAHQLPGLRLWQRLLARLVPSTEAAPVDLTRSSRAMQTAWHEAGHAVAAWLLNEHPAPSYVVVAPAPARDEGSGYMAMSGGYVYGWGSRAQLEAEVVSLCAGWQAEKLAGAAEADPGHTSDELKVRRRMDLLDLHYQVARYSPHDEARAFLVDRWEEVTVVATELVAHGGLSPRDLTRLLGPRPGASEKQAAV